MLTTIDNPFHPLKDFDNWNQWDIEHGYNTHSYLLRVAGLSVDDDENLFEKVKILSAIEIIEQDVLGIYCLKF